MIIVSIKQQKNHNILQHISLVITLSLVLTCLYLMTFYIHFFLPSCLIPIISSKQQIICNNKAIYFLSMNPYTFSIAHKLILSLTMINKELIKLPLNHISQYTKLTIIQHLHKFDQKNITLNIYDGLINQNILICNNHNYDIYLTDNILFDHIINTFKFIHIDQLKISSVMHNNLIKVLKLSQNNDIDAQKNYLCKLIIQLHFFVKTCNLNIDTLSKIIPRQDLVDKIQTLQNYCNQFIQK